MPKMFALYQDLFHARALRALGTALDVARGRNGAIEAFDEGNRIASRNRNRMSLNITSNAEEHRS